VLTVPPYLRRYVGGRASSSDKPAGKASVLPDVATSTSSNGRLSAFAKKKSRKSATLITKSVSGALLPGLDYFDLLVEQDTAVNFKYGLLFLLAISSLSVYSIILAGWSSNSKYAFIGALRSAAQMISYEVAISLLLLPVVFLAGSLNIAMIVYMQSITV